MVTFLLRKPHCTKGRSLKLRAAFNTVTLGQMPDIDKMIERAGAIRPITTMKNE